MEIKISMDVQTYKKNNECVLISTFTYYNLKYFDKCFNFNMK